MVVVTVVTMVVVKLVVVVTMVVVVKLVVTVVVVTVVVTMAVMVVVMVDNRFKTAIHFLFSVRDHTIHGKIRKFQHGHSFFVFTSSSYNTS